MKVVVTGASGFLGRALVRALLAAGHAVTATARSHVPSSGHPLLTWKRLDLGQPDDAWSNLLAGADVVYHLAWSTIPSEANRAPADDARVNVVGSLSLIQAIQNDRCASRVVFASSGGTVYGILSRIPAPEDHPLRPVSAYGVSKLAVESYLAVIHAETGLSAVSLRMGNLYGPGQSLARVFGAVTHFAHRALAGEPVRIFGDGSVTRDYLYIDDAVDALMRAGAHTAHGNFNIGTGVGHSLDQVVGVIAADLGRDLAIERLVARPFDVPVSILDASRARETFGWAPRVTFEQGIKKTLHHMQATDPVR
jgi:UDP-glucose 4-epimerase